MGYTAIISNIQRKQNSVNEKVAQIESINFDSIWRGGAHDALTLDLKKIISNLKRQEHFVSEFCTALTDLQSYKLNKEQITTLTSMYNSLPNEEEYASRRSNIQYNINSLRNKNSELKTKIQNILGKFSKFPTVGVNAVSFAIGNTDYIKNLDEYKDMYKNKPSAEQSQSTGQIFDYNLMAGVSTGISAGGVITGAYYGNSSSSSSSSYSSWEEPAVVNTTKIDIDYINNIDDFYSLYKNNKLTKIPDSGSLYSYVSKEEVQRRLNEVRQKYKGREAAVNSALCIMQIAAEKGLKLDYDFGGGHRNGPTLDSSLATGVDCSSFASWAINQGTSGNFESMTTGYLDDQGVRIAYENAQPGDILVYTRGSQGHVVLVIENDVKNGKFLVAEAQGSKYGVVLNERSYSSLRNGGYQARDLTKLYGN